MDKVAIAQRLEREFAYPEQGAKLVARKLVALSSPVREAFQEWWTSGELSDLEVEGYTVRCLRDEQGLNAIAAFLTLDWLHREPDKALDVVRRGPERVSFRTE